MSVTPQIDEGGQVILDVQFQDSRVLNHEVQVSWGDGQNNRLILTRGERSFQLEHMYADNLRGNTPPDVARIDVTITAGSLILGNPVILVIDVSGSTCASFEGSPVGDPNQDGCVDTILDAEIAGCLAINQRLIDLGLHEFTQVSLVAFETQATLLDMDPSEEGVQSYATPTADRNLNGIRDVEEAFRSLQYGGGTYYEPALTKAIEVFNSLGTGAGMGTVVFLSDGFPSDIGDFEDEVATIRDTLRQNIHAYGVGMGANLSVLAGMDAGARIFTTTDELLEVFSGGGGGEVGGGTATGNLETRVLNVAPKVDAGPDQTIRPNEAVALVGKVSDPGNVDTHVLAWSVVNAEGGLVASGDSSTLSFQPAGAGVYTATLQATDDDGGIGTDSCVITVVPGDVALVGPTVTAISRIGVHHQPTALILQFSEPLDPARAADPANYRISSAGQDGLFGTSDDVLVPVRSARYDAAHRRVVIRPARRLYFYAPHKLVVVGTGLKGVSNPEGNLLDGDTDGQAGGDHQALILGRQATKFTSPGAARAPSSTQAPALRQVRTQGLGR